VSKTMMAPLRVGIAGLGTVGASVVKMLQVNGADITRRCGRAIEVRAVSARDRDKNRGVRLDSYPWFDDAVQLAATPGLDVVVELIGGEEGVARAVCETALAHGRHVVTANKALLAHQGSALAEAAEARGVALAFEAAVAGGVPVIKALREALAGNRITEVHGILNGTCNYILTKMRVTGRAFDDVLAEAQALGYAEADPGLDIDGIDAAHKLAILTAVAFGSRITFTPDNVEGIRYITADDIRFAEALGYRIKLLGIARRGEAGSDRFEQRVHPCLVPLGTPIAGVEDVFNAVIAEGDFVERVTLIGRGAGAGPTGSAVLGDLVDIACNRFTPTLGFPVAALDPARPASLATRRGAYYLRLMVSDEVGVLAAVATALSVEQVSIERVIQHSRSADQRVPLVLTTHDTDEAAMQRGLATIRGLDSVGDHCLIRIERF